MKKTTIALTLILTVMLFAGCSTITALPMDDNTVSEAITSSPITSATPEPTPISFSGSKESSMISDEESVIPEAEATPTQSDVETEIKEQSYPSESEKADDEKASATQTKEPQSTPKSIASVELEITTPPWKAEEQPEPVPTSATTVEFTPEPVQSEPVSTPTPQPELQVMGSDFNNAILAAVNEARADYGNAPMTLDSSLCEKAVAHAKEMAKRGERFHSCGGAESVSDSSSSARTIGIRSAVHASGLTLDANRSRLGVGSVKIGDKQYTCVFSPQD